MPKSTNVNDVQCFTGFMNYLTRFSPKFSGFCIFFRRLTDKNADWLWTTVRNDAVGITKHLISRKQRLRYC